MTRDQQRGRQRGKLITTSVILAPEQITAIKLEAQRQDRSFAGVVRQAVNKYLGLASTDAADDEQRAA